MLTWWVTTDSGGKKRETSNEVVSITADVNTTNVVRGRVDVTQSLPNPWNWRDALQRLKVGDEYAFQLRVDGALTAVSFGRGGLAGKVERTPRGYELTLEARAGGGVFGRAPSFPRLAGDALGQGEVRVRAHFDELSDTEKALTHFIKKTPPQLRRATRDGVLVPASVQIAALPAPAIRMIEMGVGGELGSRLRTQMSNAFRGFPAIPNLPTMPSSARADGEILANASLTLAVPQNTDGQTAEGPELIVRFRVNAELDGALQKRKFLKVQRSEADFNGSVVYERRYPVNRATAEQMLHQPAPEVSALLEQAILSLPSSETIRVVVDQLSNEKGVRTEMLFTAGADGFDASKVQALFQPETVAKVVETLPQLGKNVHLKARIVPEEIHDVEFSPNFGILRTDGEAHLRQAGRASLWAYEGPIEQAKAPLTKAQEILGDELRRELKDFVQFGQANAAEHD